MGTPTRFDYGVTNVAKTNRLGMIGQLDPTKYISYFNDFMSLAEFNGVTTTATWTCTNAGTTPTFALADGLGGLALITNAAADDNNCFYQKKGEAFTFASGKPVWFVARFKVNDATQSDFIMGLQITDTTPLAVTDGVFFQKDDGDANLDFTVIKDSTATTASAVATVADDTFLEVAFYYDGKSAVNYYVDGALKGSSVTTNLPDDEALTISFGIQNGAAAAKTMTLDYIYVAVAR